MKRTLVALFLLVALAMPALAKAEGMYLAPKFLMSIQNTGTAERSSALAGSGISEYSQFTLGGALAAGYDFWPMHMVPLRAELEFAMRGNSETSWEGNLGSVKGTWNQSTLFANLYWDIHNDSPFTPWIGAGVGLAFTYAGYDVHRGGVDMSMDDRFTNFAWNVGAGVAYSFNENFTIDAGYRYVDFGYNEVSGTINNRNYEIGIRPYNHEFMIGLRFGF